jgi:hypothetical protein
MAGRAGRRPDDLAVVGTAVAVSSAITDDPDADLGALIDLAIA